ncbi:ApaLI family restriction endonuclease [Geminocystis sp. GBBB08]|uniref:ApaLI family restriction endonuclease n=1 Tax=Geminocystis sp. GBBB08 TaxID=2604140 RepID=UPI0027E2CE43|nr:ApaLI family restriction endonuclease [Geminocystis sp. GBBB08]
MVYLTILLIFVATIDVLDGNDAIEIKWRDATTDGDHITKEHTRIKAIENHGYKPIRVMFYYPQREQAINIQQTLENDKPIPVRIKKKDETLEDAIEAINNSEQAKKSDLKIVIQTNNYRQLFSLEDNKIIIIKSSELLINEELNKITMIAYNQST